MQPSNTRASGLADAIVRGASMEAIATEFMNSYSVVASCRSALKKRGMDDAAWEDIRTETWIVLSAMLDAGKVTDPNGVHSLIYRIAWNVCKGTAMDYQLLFLEQVSNGDGESQFEAELRKQGIDAADDFDVISARDIFLAKRKIVNICSSILAREG